MHTYVYLPRFCFLCLLSWQHAVSYFLLCDVTTFCYLEIKIEAKHFYCSLSETKKHPHAFNLYLTYLISTSSHS